MDFATWLRNWLTRHPLKEPTALDRAAYTAEVMERITTPAPVPAEAPWVAGWRRLMAPRPALALAAAAALVTAAIITATRPDGPQLAGVAGRAGEAGQAQPPRLPASATGVEPSGAEEAAADRLARELSLLADIEEPTLEPPPAGDLDALAGELELMDTLLLAEAPSEEEAWIEQTLQLLEEVDEEGAAPEHGAPEEWRDELRRLDEEELSAELDARS